MEISIPNSSSSNYFGSTIYCSMAKQKLELSFNQGFFLGIIVCFLLCSVLVESFFISKEVFELKKIYVNGKIYKLCEDR
jgi:hypothetical protein